MSIKGDMTGIFADNPTMEDVQMYGGFHQATRCYIFQPRLMVQYPNVSDLQHRHMDNVPSMLDHHHEDMLLSGEWLSGLSNGTRLFDSSLVRRELAACHDMNGLPVIVGRELYKVVRIESLPDRRRGGVASRARMYLLAPVAGGS